MKNKLYKFIIKTSDYAGNFERAMCAYLTGMVGYCGVGEEFSKLAHLQMNSSILNDFDDSIKMIPDEEDGCSRPCLANIKDVIIFFNQQPNKEMINIMKERANQFIKIKPGVHGISEFFSPPRKILGFSLECEETITKNIKI